MSGNSSRAIDDQNKLERDIGRGVMGGVYRAIDPLSDDTVVLNRVILLDDQVQTKTSIMLADLRAALVALATGRTKNVKKS